MLRCFTALLCALIFVGSVSAQSAGNMEVCDRKQPLPAVAAALTYDVASIHPHAVAMDGSLSYSDPPQFARLSVTNMTMANFIQNAYGVREYQVSGGPSWINSERFDIQARSDAAADAILASLSGCQRRQTKDHMLQVLLSDRAKLVVHSGLREVSGYNLVLAKGGSKLKASKADSDNAAAKHGGGMSMRSSRLGYSLTSQGFDLASFTWWLAAEMKQPVIDQTGLAGEYDIDLKWSENLDPQARGEAPYPAMVTALPEQLGLRLEPARLPVDTVTIDHVERPSEN